MSTTAISIEEYLRTMYDPDVDCFEVAGSPIYVDMEQIFARYDKGNR